MSIAVLSTGYPERYGVRGVNEDVWRLCVTRRESMNAS